MTPHTLALKTLGNETPSGGFERGGFERGGFSASSVPEAHFAAELAKWRAFDQNVEAFGGIDPASRISAVILAAAHGARAALDLLPHTRAVALWATAPFWLEDLAFRPDGVSLLQALAALGEPVPEQIGQAFMLFERLRPVAAPVAALLLANGDVRAAPDPETGVNRYGCRAAPTADADATGIPTNEVLALSACSANEPGERGLSAAERLRGQLMEAALLGVLASAQAASAASQRARLQTWLGLRPVDGVQVALTQSGTSATAAVADLAHRGPLPSVAIVVGPEETGREIPAAAAAGPSFVGLDSVPVRDEATGSPIGVDALEARLIERITAIHAMGADVVLHVLEGSKTGLIAPGIDCVRRLVRRFPTGLKVIADFCQMRPNTNARDYIALGAVVVATGSKFMGGPAFSGAAVIPSTWPPFVTDPVPEPGVLLRWEAALAEGEPYLRLSPALRNKGLERFVQIAREGVADFGEMELVDECNPAHILALRVRAVETDAWMTRAELERLQRWLATDASALLPARAKSFEHRLAEQRCLLGQALTIGAAGGALRIAANAARIAALAETDTGAVALNRDLSTILNKIALIRRYWEG